MRLATFSLALCGGCIPHLYSDGGDSGGFSTDTGCGWDAPTNSWSVDEPPACLRGKGFDPGQVVPDLRLNDQFGAEVSLWQFANHVILLDVSTLWCGPCQLLGDEAEETWQTYKDRGFVYVTVIQQDRDGNPARPEHVQEWADNYGLTSPVLGDPDAKTNGALQLIGGAPSFPGLLLIGCDLKVIKRITKAVPSEVEDAIADHVPSAGACP